MIELQERARVRADGDRPTGHVAWSEYASAYNVHVWRHGHVLTAREFLEQGGFRYGELLDLLGCEPKTWEPVSL